MVWEADLEIEFERFLQWRQQKFAEEGGGFANTVLLVRKRFVQPHLETEMGDACVFRRQHGMDDGFAQIVECLIVGCFIQKTGRLWGEDIPRVGAIQGMPVQRFQKIQTEGEQRGVAFDVADFWSGRDGVKPLRPLFIVDFNSGGNHVNGIVSTRNRAGR